MALLLPFQLVNLRLQLSFTLLQRVELHLQREVGNLQLDISRH